MGDLEQNISAVATKSGATEQELQYLLVNNLPDIIYDVAKNAYDKMK